VYLAHFNAVEQYSTSVVAGQLTPRVELFTPGVVHKGARASARVASPQASCPCSQERGGGCLSRVMEMRLLAGLCLNGRDVQAVEGQGGFDAIAEVRAGRHV